MYKITDLTEAQERMMNRTEITEEGCWEWRGAQSPSGYGVMRLRNQKRGNEYATIGTHTVSWMAYNTQLSEDGEHMELAERMEVDHICKNPSCCNPAHLRLLTRSENAVSTSTNKRSRRFLTLHEIVEIYCCDLTHQEVAQKLNIDYRAVTEIRRGQRHRKITQYLRKGQYPKRAKGGSCLLKYKRVV